MNNRWRLVVGLLVSVLAMAAALWGIDFGQLLGALKGADGLFLLISLATLILTLVFRAFRWRVLLGGEVSLGRCWSVLTIGYLLNTVLPARAGEFARPYLISRDRPFSSSQALTSVALERILDLLSVVLLFGLSLPFVHVTQDIARTGGLLTAIALGALGVLVLATRWPAAFERVGEQVLTRLFRANALGWTRRWRDLLAGLSPLRDPRQLAETLFWTAAIWISAIGTIYYGILAFVQGVPVAVATFVLAALGGAVSVPSSPGQIGVYEWTARYTLNMNGVEEHLALAIGITMHFINLAPLIVLGAISLAREGESIQQLLGETYTWLARTTARKPVSTAPAAAAESEPAALASEGK